MSERIEPDVLILGAGAAGIAAAIGASQSNASVFLAEKSNRSGGRATASAVGTICGLYLRSNLAKFAMQGFPKYFAEKIIAISGSEALKTSDNLRYLPCEPDEFEKVATEVLEENKIKIHFGTELENISVDNRRIESLSIVHQNRKIKVSPAAVIDCSGKGEILSKTNHPLQPTEMPQASAVVFRVSGVKTESEFSLQHVLLHEILKKVSSGDIPASFKLLSLIPGSLKADTLMFKLGLDWSREQIMNNSAKEAEQKVNEIFEFLHSEIAGFRDSTLDWIAAEPGQRTGIRPIGKFTLTEDQILSCSKTNDSICNGAWPIEFWESGNPQVRMSFFQEDEYYSIPAPCLSSSHIENLFFAGKLISASEKAIASARVIGTCLGTGYAAGVMAAFQAAGKNEKDAIAIIQEQMLSCQNEIPRF